MGSIAGVALDMSGLKERVKETREEVEVLVQELRNLRSSISSGGGGGGGGSNRGNLVKIENTRTPFLGDLHARNLTLAAGRTNQLLEQIATNTGGGGGGGAGGRLAF